MSLDAPQRGDMKEISRVDILSIILASLNSTFVILLDDFNRQTEKNLAKLLFEELDKNQIAYVFGTYDGEKKHSFDRFSRSGLFKVFVMKYSSQPYSFQHSDLNR